MSFNTKGMSHVLQDVAVISNKTGEGGKEAKGHVLQYRRKKTYTDTKGAITSWPENDDDYNVHTDRNAGGEDDR